MRINQQADDIIIVTVGKSYSDPGHATPYNIDEYMAALLNFQGKLPAFATTGQPEAVQHAVAWHHDHAFTADLAYMQAYVNLHNAGVEVRNFSIDLVEHISPDLAAWTNVQLVGVHF